MTQQKLIHAFKVAAALAAVLLYSANACATTYQYTLTTTIFGFVGWAVNDSGQIAGFGPYDNAEIYTPESGLQNIPMPAGVKSSIARAINNSGQVAGGATWISSAGDSVNGGFIYTPSNPTPTVLIPNQILIVGTNISESGIPYQISGPLPSYAKDSGIYASQSITGYKAGYTFVGTDQGHAFLQNPDGTFINVGSQFGAQQSQAYGVNSSGQVVGRVIGSNGLSAFEFSTGAGAVNLFDATDPVSRAGWSLFASAQGITTDGRIIGWGNDYRSNIGYSSTFILTPVRTVPEPSSFYLILSGLLIGAYSLAKRRTRPISHESR
jgi:uncharacterized membrane protein